MTDTAQIFQFPSAPEGPREKRGAQLEDGYVPTALIWRLKLARHLARHR